MAFYDYESLRVVARALQYYGRIASKVAENPNSTDDKGRTTYDEEIVKLVETDMNAASKKASDLAQELNKTATDIENEKIYFNNPPRILKTERDIIVASLESYQTELQRIEKIPGNKGLSKATVPSVEKELKLVKDAMRDLELELPPAS